MTTGRDFTLGALLAGATAALPARADDKPAEIRTGTQKGGFFPSVRQRGSVEQAFAPLGIAIRWVDFPFGPPLLEAINVGSATSAMSATPRRSSPRPAARASATPPW